MNPSTTQRVDRSSPDSTYSYPEALILDHSVSLNFRVEAFQPDAPYHAPPEMAVLDTTTVLNLTANIETVAARDGVENTNNFTEAHAISNCQVFGGISLGDDFLKTKWIESSNETSLMEGDYGPAWGDSHTSNSPHHQISEMEGSERPGPTSGQSNSIVNFPSHGRGVNRGGKARCQRCAERKLKCDFESRNPCYECQRADKARKSANPKHVVCVSSHIEDSNIFPFDALVILPLPPTLNLDALYALPTSDDRINQIQTLLQDFHYFSSSLVDVMKTEPLYNLRNEEVRKTGLQIVDRFNSLFHSKWYEQTLPDLRRRTAELVDIFMQLAGTYRGLKDLRDEPAFLAKHENLKHYCRYIVDRIARNGDKSTGGGSKDKI